MGFETSQFDYILGENLATMENANITGGSEYAKGSKVSDKGVYEITFSYSVRNSDTTAAGNPHFYIGFGTYVGTKTASFFNNTVVRLGADNTATQSFPNQRSVTVWVTKTDEAIRDFLCGEGVSNANWYMYNINAVAKKIADI